MFRHVRKPTDGASIVKRLEELAAERRRVGYRQLHVLLLRDGIKINVKSAQLATRRFDKRHEAKVSNGIAALFRNRGWVARRKAFTAVPSNGTRVTEKVKIEPLSDRELSTGMEIHAVQKVLGHTEASTTANIYGHVVDGRTRAAVESIPSMLGTVDLSAARERKAAKMRTDTGERTA
jgi:integrase